MAAGGQQQQQQRGTKRSHQQMLQVWGGPCNQLFNDYPLKQDGGSEGNGGYTLEVAKSRLHLFLQQTRQPKDMQIRPVGPEHHK